MPQKKPCRLSRVISKQDLQYIEQQLGRKPQGIIEVTVRSKNGKPLVIKTKPVLVRSRKSKVRSEKEIFPTLYYLVSRSVIEQVAKLESESFLSQMQEKVNTDNNFKTALLKAQEEYRNERNSLVDLPLSDSQKEALETGIGGVKDFTRIKCLHCHLAHYLATKNNPVGEEVSKYI